MGKLRFMDRVTMAWFFFVRWFRRKGTMFNSYAGHVQRLTERHDQARLKLEAAIFRHHAAREKARESTGLELKELDAKLKAAEDQVGRTRRDHQYTRERLKTFERTVEMQNGELQVLKAQLEMYVAWENRERERYAAEAAIQVRRRLKTDFVSTPDEYE